jgi:hypothetical protein
MTRWEFVNGSEERQAGALCHRPKPVPDRLGRASHPDRFGFPGVESTQQEPLSEEGSALA